MTNQSLEYVFPFSRFAFQTDVACLVLSEGRKSTFFQTHINVPLRPEAGKSAELYKPANQVKLPSAETLTVFRDYLGAAKIGSVTIGDTVAEVCCPPRPPRRIMLTPSVSTSKKTLSK
jgi:hypothetical protein